MRSSSFSLVLLLLRWSPLLWLSWTKTAEIGVLAVAAEVEV
jgi:hypothetical protein